MGDGQTVTSGLTGPEFLNFTAGGSSTNLMAVIKGLSDALQGGSTDPAQSARDALGALDTGLETVTTAVIQNSLVTSHVDDTPSWNALMARLAARSRSHYRTLVHDNPDLVAFFQQVTPIEEISKLQISSRPARRKSGAKDLSSLRAIPWVFGWTQSRFLLPSWFGVGAALQEELDGDPAQLELFQQLYQRWPFFRMLISKVEMTLSKVDLDLAHHYVRSLGRPESRQAFEQFAAALVDRLRRDLAGLRVDESGGIGANEHGVPLMNPGRGGPGTGL